MIQSMMQMDRNLAKQFTPLSLKIAHGLQTGMARRDGVSRLLGGLDLTRPIPTDLATKLSAQYARMVPSESQMLGAIGNQIRTLTQVGGAPGGVAGSVLAAWNTGVIRLVESMGMTGLTTRNDALAHRFMAPSKVVADVLAATQGLAANAGNAGLVARHVLAAELIEFQWLDHAELLGDTLPSLHDGFDGSPEPQRKLLLPEIQREQLLGVETEEEVDAWREESVGPPAVSAAARRVLRRLRECNMQARMRSDEDIFKPTNQLLAAFIDLPWLLARDEKSLGDVVDSLYFLLYEAAGKDKLRFRADGGGPLADQECGVVWTIKHLRNSWLRHDIEHGAKGKTRRQYSVLADDLAGLGFERLPSAPGEFQRLHLSLLRQVEEFLEALFSGI